MNPQDFWQTVHPPGSFDPAPAAGHTGFFPATLPCGAQVLFPIRRLPSGGGVASLILNQASIAVEDAFSAALAEALRPHAPQIVVGVPTLGLTLARGAARALGHARYAPMGFSRKFWYDDALSAPVSSITSPGAEKRLYLDPRLLPLLRDARVALVDDALSTGRSILAALEVLRLAGVAPVAIGCAMLQTEAWRAALAARRPEMLDRVAGVVRTPLLEERAPDRWFAAG